MQARSAQHFCSAKNAKLRLRRSHWVRINFIYITNDILFIFLGFGLNRGFSRGMYVTYL